jgi:sortase (surface protein transpeptidase)
MKSKIILKWLLIVTSIIAITFSVIIVFIDIIQAKQDPIYVKPVVLIKNIVAVVKPISGLPERLIIPKIKVDAPFEYVGLTPLGAMDVPKIPANVGWFDLGPRPGDTGSAVVAGHYGWKNNIPAVFDDLSKLRSGDEIFVIDDKGATSTFIVREIGTYSQKGDASNVFGSNDNIAHLNLITCEGTWNAFQKSYSNRLVIFTDKEI